MVTGWYRTYWEQLDADSLLGQYGLGWELHQTQIQMGPVWDGHSRENVAILKQALEIFPPFHEEVRSVLMRLK